MLFKLDVQYVFLMYFLCVFFYLNNEISKMAVLSIPYTGTLEPRPRV